LISHAALAQRIIEAAAGIEIGTVFDGSSRY